MLFDSIEWDEDNLDHATRRRTREEIEQVLFNSDRWKRHPEILGRFIVVSFTDGGRKAVVVVHYDRGRDRVRPITAWEV